MEQLPLEWFLIMKLFLVQFYSLMCFNHMVAYVSLNIGVSAVQMQWSTQPVFCADWRLEFRRKIIAQVCLRHPEWDTSPPELYFNQTKHVMGVGIIRFLKIF